MVVPAQIRSSPSSQFQVVSADVREGPHTALIVLMDAGSCAVCQTTTKKKLVRSVASSAASTVAATVASPRRETAPSTEIAPATASAEGTSTASTAARHAGNIRALGDDLDVAALEDTLVENKGLCDQARLGEFDIRVTIG